MGVRDKIREVLEESNFKSPNGSFGEKQNRGQMYLRREDTKRKRKERARGAKPQGTDSKKRKDTEDILDPRELKSVQRRQLSGELRLTPKEAFVSRLIAYLESNHSKHMMEAIKLLEEYPKLKNFVSQTSQKALPKNNFAVYSARERLSEEIGEKGYRSPGNHHNWTLSRSQIKEIWECDEAYIMETKISPTDVIIYLPAFSKMMEKVIYEGLVDEPMTNVIRKAKFREEVVLSDKFDHGIIVEVA